MQTLDSKLPLKLGISERKKLLSLLSGVIVAPIMFFIFYFYFPPFEGLSSFTNAISIAFVIGAIFISYPLFLAPYIKITEKALYVRGLGLFRVEWPFEWKHIQTFKVVETRLPIGSNFSLIPYTKKAIGLDYKGDLPIDPLSGKQDSMLKKFYAPRKFFLGAQVIFPDSTTIFDSTTYSLDPESLVVMLNEYRENFTS
jgi:hypothetical protein